jgi:putative cardiolipin synthase
MFHHPCLPLAHLRGLVQLQPALGGPNTEMGRVIESPLLARHLAGAFEGRIPPLAHEVLMAPENRGLQWLERTPTGKILHATAPETTLGRRLGVDLISLLPIKWML